MNDSEKMLHFYWILMFFLTLVLAPSMTGILCKVKALSAGRRGPSIFLPYRELWKRDPRTLPGLRQWHHLRL